jgi:hypothetical protein
VGQFLQETGVSLGADDEGPFAMRLLHFRRTFVEKMFAIHGKFEAFKKAGKEIGGYLCPTLPFSAVGETA